jgi:transcription elongation GreA/GreB family factor
VKRKEIIELLGIELQKIKDSYSPEDYEQEEKLLNDTLEAIPQNQEVGIGSIVKLFMNGKENTYFFATTMGGTLLRYREKPLLVISIFSSFAGELMGRVVGETIYLEKEGMRREVKVLSIE